ncbi:MAG TPA: hypothetical protein PLA50_11295, partial [Bacteroidia bacterium]|nr:hypothetical protein [Bacteroidia bacterium]
SGYITRDGFNAAGSPRLSTEGEWPVDPTFLFVHYRYDEAEYEQIHRARSNHIDDLSVKTTTVPFAGGIGIEAWTTVRPD